MSDEILPPERGEIQSVSEAAGAHPDLKHARRHKPIRSDVEIAARQIPNAPGAEQGTLGCALLSPNDCLPQIIERIRGNTEVFYDLRNKTIMDALIAMTALDPGGVDVITLQQWLKDDGMLDQVGGIPYLNSLQDAVPSAANLSYYMDLMIEKFVLRRIIEICTDIVGRIYDFEGEVDQLLDEVERDILRISQEFRFKAVSQTGKMLLPRALETIEKFFQRQGETFGLKTGFTDLDRMTDGFHGGEMIVIAARPSMGKSSIAMNVAENIVVNQKLPVGVFSLEMTADSLMLRALCSSARVNMRSVRDGFMSAADFPKLTGAAGKFNNDLLVIDDTPGLSIMELRARARNMWQKFGIKLFVVDYIQLLHSTTKRSRDNRQQEITEISSGIKALAKELNVPILVLSQLNRDLEKDKSRKPRLSDLRESGAIEQDADVVGLLYKPKQGDDEEEMPEEDQEGIPVNLLIAKQRNGPTGDVNLTFLKPFTRFESAAKVSDEDVPVENQS